MGLSISREIFVKLSGCLCVGILSGKCFTALNTG